MKSVRSLLVGTLFGIGLIVGLHLLPAQETATSNPNGLTVQELNSMSDLQVMLQAIESVPPIPAASVPKVGTFYSAQHPPGSRLSWPPLPGNDNQLPVWNLGDGVYLLDDRNVDYDELQAETDLAAALNPSPMMRTSLLAGGLASSYAYGNPVYLTNMAALSAGDGNVTASFSIAGGTNFVPYDILISTNMTTSFSQWNWLGIGYTSNRYTFSSQPADSAFYMLAKPSKTMTVAWGDDYYGESDVPSGITNALMVAGSYAYSLALLGNGTVAGWGYSYIDGWVPTNLVGVAMVGCGWNHNVALFTNGTVTAWGNNFSGQLNVPSNLTNATVISAQADHTLALRRDGTVVGWGDDSAHQSDVPAGLTNVTAIAAGGEFSLAVSNGFVVAWGDDSYGQCSIPAGLSNVWDVEAGFAHSAALKMDGTVVCWGDNYYGESSVPAGLSNVVAIAAGGNPFSPDYGAYTLALKSDGTVVAWGESEATAALGGLNNVIAIAGGDNYGLAIRTGPPTPVITLEPVDQYQVAGGNVTFTAKGQGLYGVTYQWQTNGVNTAGATNATLTLTNVQAAQQENYQVVVSDNYGSITSSNAAFEIVTVPVVHAQSLPTNQVVLYQDNVTLSAAVTAPGQDNGFPISYQWQFDGTNISSATSSNYTFSAVNSGTYSEVISNAAGSTNISWNLTVLYPGNAWAWGEDDYGQADAPAFTNISAIAVGEYHSVAVRDDGSVVQWGYDWADVPANLTNAISVAAGYEHSIALRADGTVTAWGYSNCPAIFIPSNLPPVKAVAAGWLHSVVLLTNGTVRAWGDNYFGQTNVPADLTNVIAISACSYHNLALKSDGTVEGWGYNFDGITTPPPGLSNVVAICAGFQDSLALKADGTIVVWGDNSAGQTNVPAGLSNVMAVAAGWYHCVALKNDGTIVCWGDNSNGQTNVPDVFTNPITKLIAAGGDTTLAALFSPLVQYPVDVTKDVLLIYNSNSTNSIALKDYYLAHRPMIAGANVLGVACDVGEFTTSTNCNAEIVAPVLNWLTNNPTKRPQYVILFYDIPTRLTDLAWDLNDTSPYFRYGSVSYHLHNNLLRGWQPFVNNLNAGTLTDCKAYVNKLESIGTNYSPGKLIISANAGGYGNTNYYFDEMSEARDGVLNVNPEASVTFSNAYYENFPVFNETYSEGLTKVLSNHITTGFNIAGYSSLGAHSSLVIYYTNAFGLQSSCFATNGFPTWSGHSGWWLIETVESHNGKRLNEAAQSNFIQWFSSIAFGGTNYANTPVGAVCHVEEPGLGNHNYAYVYFGLWEAGKNFAICAWNSRKTPYFQAVGDPLVTK